ncbi:BA14K family protein [Caulobacter sp. LARHSG274]
MKRSILVAIGATLLAIAPLTATAQSNAPDRNRPPGGSGPGYGGPGGPGAGPNRPPPRPNPTRPSPPRPGYGHWNPGWGHRPPPPPSHWGRPGSWYQHVRACQMRYRSYNPRTDSYRLRPGAWRRCRL